MRPDALITMSTHSLNPKVFTSTFFAILTDAYIQCHNNSVLTYGNINVRVPYFLLLGYFVMTTLTVILILNGSW